MSDNIENPQVSALTIHDYFAAKAMQEFIRISRDNYNHGNAEDGGFTWVAEMACKQATAMMKARVK